MRFKIKYQPAGTRHMSHNPETLRKTYIYHVLDDGRIVELRLGKSVDSDDAVWARNLTAGEKEIYLKLKRLGHSDMDIFKHFNSQKKRAS